MQHTRVNPLFARAVARMRTAAQPSVELCRMVHEEPHMPRLLRLADSIPAGPVQYHSGSVLRHLARVVDAVAGDPVAVWMGFVHDLGKLTTPSVLWPHHYGHELRGAAMAQYFGELAGLPPELVAAGCFCACQHMRAGNYPHMRTSKRRQLIHAVETAGVSAPFWKVVDADRKAAVSALMLQDLEVLRAAG